MDGKIGVFVVVTFVLLHRLCHSNIPKLNLQKNEQRKDGAMILFVLLAYSVNPLKFTFIYHTFTNVLSHYCT